MSYRPDGWPKRSRTTTYGGFKIERRPNARGSTIADQNAPTIMLTGQGMMEMLTGATTLCLPEGAICALDATNEQIVRAVAGDESICARQTT